VKAFAIVFPERIKNRPWYRHRAHFITGNGGIFLKKEKKKPISRAKMTNQNVFLALLYHYPQTSNDRFFVLKPGRKDRQKENEAENSL
jgi:hypothetical protein